MELATTRATTQKPAAFDEMRGPDGAIRPAYATLADWLKETPQDVLEYRRREAEFIFRRIGITFAVYGEAEAQERLIPFDIIPRILTHEEWTRLGRGLEQRVNAINAFLRDVYGKREILRAGVVPEELVYRNEAFRPEMNHQKVPHDIYVAIAGIDLVRTNPDEFYVLEDNTRVPSGVSYMLENREIMMRLFPELFESHAVEPVENYVDDLLATLISIAPAASPREPNVAIMTPGIHNSAYYEHSFLADKLGVELVEGRDLFVNSNVVYMRTTEGPKRVDVLYRRVDDEFIDPLTFSPRAAFDGIRWGSSVLVVAAPVFFWLSWLLEKEFRLRPEKRELRIRKWLVYLTLFITAIVIIVDVMILIYNFYGGDLTTQFALKILTVLAVAAAVFGYYLWDLRRGQTATDRHPRPPMGHRRDRRSLRR
jgi:uncharacterized circularly permuted ATP-grasp superfamily protein